MATKLVLRVVKGPLLGREYTIESPRLCRIGRSRDCDLRFPGDDEFLNVSRHHCLLDVEVSGVEVRDLGSRNGTYLNELKIGQRDRDWSVTRLGAPELDTYELTDGDTLRIGDIVFRADVIEESVEGDDRWKECAESPIGGRDLCGAGAAHHGGQS